GALRASGDASGGLGGPAARPPISIDGRALGAADEPLDLVVGEPGETASVPGDRDADLIGGAVLADAAQVEALVDRLLKLDRAPAPLGIAPGQLVEPARAHPHVGDLVGQHVVDRALDDGVAQPDRDADELGEDVAGQPLEPAVDAGHASSRVLRARAAPEDG